MAGGTSSPQMALPFVHADKASFDNFWVGRNTELVSALKRISELPSSGEGINNQAIYFYGSPGSGKSHLLFAATRAANETQSGLSTANHTSYLSLNNDRVVVEMLPLINAAGLVCVDNIQAWAGDRHKENALFTLFEQIKHSGGQLIVSAIQPPAGTGFVINDLVSRLASGLLYPIYQLNDDERFAAIKLRANQRGLKIADDAVKYFVSRSSRDTHELFKILDHIDKTSLAEQRRITIPFLQNLFKDT